MLEVGQGLGLAKKPLAALGIPGQIGRKNLESQLAAQTNVPGTVEVGHAAGTQPGKDFVVGEGLADHDGVRTSRVG
jgi:hypothetical protein